jgi:mannosyltransferase OCH1-like enzyme
VRKCIATWHRHLSDYEFCLWNEDTCAAYAATHNLPNPLEHPFVKGAYAAKKYAFVADYVRFWALYHCGGVYLDTDMYVVRSFDTLLDAEFFCGWETKRQDNINVAIVGTSCNNACVKIVLEQYNTFVFDVNKLDKFIVPRVVTPIIFYRLDVTIYPYDYFYAFPWGERDKSNPEKYITKNSYALHLWDISWEPWYKKIVRQFVIEIKKILYA